MLKRKGVCILQYKFETETGTLFVYMPKEVDHHLADKVRLEMDRLFVVYPVRKMVFDFADTIFMDSSGIGLLLGRCKNLKYAGGQASAVHLNQQMERIFKISGLHKLILVEEKQ